MSESKQEVLQIDLAGKDPELFKSLFSNFEKAITSIVDRLSKTDIEPTTKAAIGEVVYAAQTFIEAKLKEPTIKNKKMLAEITKLYAEAEEKLASARERHAAAEKTELENIEKKLDLVIKMMDLMGNIKVVSSPEGLIIDLTRRVEE